MLCTNQCKLCSRTRTRGIPRQTSQSAHSQNPAKLIGSPATLIRRTVVAAAIHAIDFPWAMPPLLGVHPSSSPCSCVSCPSRVGRAATAAAFPGLENRNLKQEKTRRRPDLTDTPTTLPASRAKQTANVVNANWIRMVSLLFYF